MAGKSARRLAWLLILSAVVLIGRPALADRFDVVTVVPSGDPNVTIWRIDSPNVTQPATLYPAIRFNPGDRLSVDAGGCVQTGGHGKTWKLYVDPRGDNADRLYHGLITIPGVVPTTRIQNFGLNEPHLVPFTMPLPLVLQLGYEDDNYSDNGYYSHDDGNPEQCKNVGNAWVTVTVRHPQRGAFAPKYAVVTVVYAPPGSGAGAAAVSSATYGSTSTTGTTTSSSQSFGSQYSESVGLSPSIYPLSLSTTNGFVSSTQSGTTSAVSVVKSTALTIAVSGPTVDGIDHGQDEIWLWLNPLVQGALSGNQIAWVLANAGGPEMKLQYVKVKWLKNPSDPEFAGVKQTLASYGITSADYPTILARDPFASGSSTIDPSRFVPAATSFPYEPGGGQPLTETVDNTQTGTLTGESSDSYTVGSGVSGGIDLGFMTVALSNQNAWTWTNTNTTALTSSTTQSISTTVGYPSASWSGMTMVDVYYDTIYRTFLFAFDTQSSVSARESAALKGQVVAGGAAPVARELVVLTLGGKRYRTLTNTKGWYYFNKNQRGAGQLTVRGATHAVTLGPGTVVRNVSL